MKTLLTAAALSIGLAASAQNYNDLVEVLRSDLRTQHQAIVLDNLQLNEAQSAAFTPIWDAYNAELKKHWDKRIQLVKDYASQYQTMNDEAAASLMKRMSTLDKENIKLRDTYGKKISKVLPTTIAARWVQIENRLNMLVQLQLASEIPLMPKK